MFTIENSHKRIIMPLPGDDHTSEARCTCYVRPFAFCPSCRPADYAAHWAQHCPDSSKPVWL